MWHCSMEAACLGCCCCCTSKCAGRRVLLALLRSRAVLQSHVCCCACCLREPKEVLLTILWQLLNLMPLLLSADWAIVLRCSWPAVWAHSFDVGPLSGAWLLAVCLALRSPACCSCVMSNGQLCQC
jgi:hypothetical protein